MLPVRTEQGPAGEILHIVSHPAAALPAVTKRDLEQAWEVASAAALAPGENFRDTHARLIRFAVPERPPLDLLLADRDAAIWVNAIDNVADLSTIHGISVCLRLLALVDLMGRAAWARAWFNLGSTGLEFHPALLRAASLSPLTETGGFAETALRALLPGGADQQE